MCQCLGVRGTVEIFWEGLQHENGDEGEEAAISPLLITMKRILERDCIVSMMRGQTRCNQDRGSGGGVLPAGSHRVGGHCRGAYWEEHVETFRGKLRALAAFLMTERHAVSLNLLAHGRGAQASDGSQW